MVGIKEFYALEIPDQDELGEWCCQFTGMLPNNGDVFPPTPGDPTGTSLAGRFLSRIEGKLLFIEVDDHGWHRYDFDEGENESGDPPGYNYTETTIIDIDECEIVWLRGEAEHDESNGFQGLAVSVARAIREKHKYPHGDWVDVLHMLDRDVGLFDD